MKRSARLIPLTIGLAASAFALSACKPEVTEVDAQLFPDTASCYAAADSLQSTFSRADCDNVAADAQAQHAATAPRYDALAACEAEYGTGNCETAQNTGGGGGSFFMPLLMGYLMGNMLSGGRHAAQPLYSKPGGGYTTADRGTSFNSNSGSSRVNASSFGSAATATRGGTSAGNTRPVAAPMSQSSVRSTGGFGGGFGGGSSFGG
ncbi:hypothetical protein BVG79_02122 [Ketogulonicigenium robustum]|uniref:Lipoprotein n=1 Tax=Ketogulonicigenium robustum TaxID=92947 RepID=A0A1W6P1S8_9RHOB|nr:DUF1190 domain-containing protein [Ketogulonicigenium robustum]ARO15462.1 hypothetical protein BVG79_02122 [Ketogulonicigenium robustum]